MALLDTTLDIGIAAIAASITHLSLSTADPGTTGTNQNSAAS